MKKHTKNDKKIDVEQYLDIGDVVFFDPIMHHEVSPISSNSVQGNDIQWNNPAGRWMMFTTITPIQAYFTPHEIYKDYQLNK